MNEKVIDNSVFVVCSPRMPTPARSTGEIVRDGSRIEEVKQIVFADAFLRPLASIKSQVRRMLLRVATPVDAVNAWLVPTSVWPQVKTQIEEAEKRWVGLVKKLELDLGRQTQELCAQFPKQAVAIQENTLSPVQFRKATTFIFGAFVLTKEQLLESSSLTTELGDLAYQVLDDLAKLIVDGKRDKSPSTSASTCDFIEMLQAKAQAFAFVDERVSKVAVNLGKALKALPKGVTLLGSAADLANAIFAKLMRPGEVLRNGLDIDSQIRALKAEAKPKAPKADTTVVAAMQLPAATVNSAAKAVEISDVVAATLPDHVKLIRHNPVCV